MRPLFTVAAIRLTIQILLFCLIAGQATLLTAAQPPEEARPAWATSRISGSPLPPPPFQTTNRFPHLKFDQPLYLELDSAGQRLWVGERNGRIYSFPDRADCQQADLFVDLRESFDQLVPNEGAAGVGSFYGLAFHPDYPRVPVCWMTYVLTSKERGHNLPDGTRLSRFRVNFENGIPICDVPSEQVVLTWLEGGHNGACLKFGPDGCLYISAGDGAGPNPPDPLRAGQDLTNLLSTVMRIEVNPGDDGPLYSVPDDNPFVTGSGQDDSAAADGSVPGGALPEIWAYGFRNPWKMTFGPDGQLWVGDVGWEMYEMVFNVKRGGNYGWSIMEGPQPVLPNQPRAPSRILPAATAYSHAEGASVTGGYVYRGSKFDELSGKYVFGDFETRRIWSAAITPVDGESDALTELTDLIEPSVRIVAFAEDSENELLLLDFDRGTIHGLEANPLSDQPSDFPTTLSDTGLFQDTASQTVAAGVVPFEVTAPMWNDGAQAERWVAVPGTGSIEVLPGPRQLRESSLRERMHFPTDSVLARTITLNDDNDKPVRLETQLLHFNGKIWNGYTYVWNPEQTDAKLAATEGTAITLADYGQFADRSTWKVHSRSECNRCHNLWVGGTLAFTVPQLNRFTDHDGAGSATSARSDTGQLNRMQAMGLLTGRVPAAPASGDRSALTDPYDATANLSHRARSYLAVNCAHCHQNGAGGTSTIDLRPDITLDEMKSLNASPAQGLFQMANASVISPGDPLRSVLYYRTACSGRGRMPHIGSEEVDVAAVAMLGEWIRSLGEQPTEQLASAVDVPRSTRDALRLVAMFDHDQLDAETQTRILKHVREAAPEISNLFTRFQPLEYRRSLSQPLNAAKILATQGDPQHGARLFADNRLQCANCHRIGDVGGRIGPALNDVGKRLKADEILEAVLEPSKKIDPKFAAWTIITESGRVHSGLLIDRTESEIILRTAANEDVRISRQQIEEQFQQVTSLMPDRLLSGLSEQDVADLIAFLSQQQTPRLLTIPNNSHHLPSRNTVSCFE